MGGLARARGVDICVLICARNVIKTKVTVEWLVSDWRAAVVMLVVVVVAAASSK